jgi:hypothetical protein
MCYCDLYNRTMQHQYDLFQPRSDLTRKFLQEISWESAKPKRNTDPPCNIIPTEDSSHHSATNSRSVTACLPSLSAVTDDISSQNCEPTLEYQTQKQILSSFLGRLSLGMLLPHICRGRQYRSPNIQKVQILPSGSSSRSSNLHQAVPRHPSHHHRQTSTKAVAHIPRVLGG